MKFFYDTEFYEDGKQIHLISIGMVSEEGHEFYLENKDFDWDIVPKDHWIQINVRPHLDNNLYGVTKDRLVYELKDFVQSKSLGNNEFWGYYADYDHVVLAQLFGRMVDMPRGFPWYTLDIKQEAYRLGNPELPDMDEDWQEHHAGFDARWNKKAWEFLRDLEQEREDQRIW